MGITLLIGNADRLCVHHGNSHDGSLPGMVLVAGSVHILPGEGLSESGTLEHQVIGRRNDDWFLWPKVRKRATCPIDDESLHTETG